MCFAFEGKGLKNLNFKGCKPLYLLSFGRLCDIIVAKIIPIIDIPSLDSACLKMTKLPLTVGKGHYQQAVFVNSIPL